MSGHKDFILAKVDVASRLLAEARTATDAKKIADLARAAEVYARRQKASQEVIEYATSIKVDALALMGEMLKVAEKQAGGRGMLPPGPGRGHKGENRSTQKEPLFSPKPNGVLVPPPTLADLGISKKESAAAQALADVKAKDPELYESASKGKTRISQVIHEVKREKQKADRQDRIKEAEKKTAKVAGFVHGDFREVAKQVEDGSVDLIFTDPPYDRKTLPLYGDLARIAAEKLVDGGSLVCYLGQYLIGEVLDLVRPHLRLWWTLAVVHTGRSARMNEYGVVVKWKPLLWFVRGTRADKLTFVDDLVVSREEKDTHDWQQSVEEARYYIEKLAPPRGLVFDPFCGGGTTAKAAKNLGRRFLTCDIDSGSLALAKERVA